MEMPLGKIVDVLERSRAAIVGVRWRKSCRCAWLCVSEERKRLTDETSKFLTKRNPLLNGGAHKRDRRLALRRRRVLRRRDDHARHRDADGGAIRRGWRNSRRGGRRIAEEKSRRCGDTGGRRRAFPNVGHRAAVRAHQSLPARGEPG